MKREQLDLFNTPKEPRQPARVLMHVWDAGEPGCVFKCTACDFESDWIPVWAREDQVPRPAGVLSLTEAKAGIPCPKCNAVLCVDPLAGHGWVLRGRTVKSCHFFAAPEHREALHDLAARIGMKRRWFDGDNRIPHYDLTTSRRAAAVELGAVSLDRRAAVAFWKEHYPRRSS